MCTTGHNQAPSDDVSPVRQPTNTQLTTTVDGFPPKHPNPQTRNAEMSKCAQRSASLASLGTRPICRQFSCSRRLSRARDPRIRDIGRQIEDDYAAIRKHYATPKHPIVLAHGLLGFSELHVPPFPRIHYWHGIREALTAQGATVVAASVPPSSSIADRASRLADEITRSGVDAAAGVNIVAHSMGGLDARWMIAHTLRQRGLPVRVASLTTVSSPHRGSPFADYVLRAEAGPLYLPRVYGVLERAGLETSAFAQLTTAYMRREFNPATPDDPAVRYFSYGAVADPPPLLSPFRVPGRIVGAAEGANDGLVSVQSARWGAYQGTLVGVNHLDLINWPNRLRWVVRGWMGRRRFNAVAFYLGIADMLAREGL
ncbi:GPI inositol-deacylase PGAP1-like protein [Metarhizium brunneum]